MYDISDVEKKIIDLISNVTKTIAIVYERLLFADMILEQKESSTYDELFLNLKDLIKKEEKLYKALNINVENEEIFWNYFVESNNLKNFKMEDQFVDICHGNSRNLWNYRVFNRFQDFLPDSIEIYNFNIDSDEDSFEDNIDLDDDTFDDNIYYLDSSNLEEMVDEISEDGLRDAINNDFQRAFVYFLGEDIKEDNNSFFKDIFNMVRYNILFITPEIEKDLLDNKLRNKEDLYFVFPMASGLLEINKEHYKEVQVEEATEFCIEAIENMIDLQKHDKSFSRYVDINSHLFSVYFRSGLSLIYNRVDHDKIMQEIIEQINIDDSEYNDINPIIDMSLKKIRNDRIKCKYLSLYNEK